MNYSSLAPSGEREARKAVGEGASTKLHLIMYGLVPKGLTPSPVSHRLVKAPDAIHPLPQGGEGSNFKLTFPRR